MSYRPHLQRGGRNTLNCGCAEATWFVQDCKLQEAKMASCFPILTAPSSCKKKNQLTFRCQVNDYSSTDNIHHFDNLIGVGFAPWTKRLDAILRLRRRSAGLTESQVIQLTILKGVGSVGRWRKSDFVRSCGWLRQRKWISRLARAYSRIYLAMFHNLCQLCQSMWFRLLTHVGLKGK